MPPAKDDLSKVRPEGRGYSPIEEQQTVDEPVQEAKTELPIPDDGIEPPDGGRDRESGDGVEQERARRAANLGTI